MNKKLFYIAWISYLIGIIIVLSEIYIHSNSPEWIYLLIGTAFFLIPWVICIVHAAKTNSINSFWIFFLLIMSSIAVPLFLVRYGKKV